MFMFVTEKQMLTQLAPTLPPKGNYPLVINYYNRSKRYR